jgi:hypothetical protein
MINHIHLRVAALPGLVGVKFPFMDVIASIPSGLAKHKLALT